MHKVGRFSFILKYTESLQKSFRSPLLEYVTIRPGMHLPCLMSHFVIFAFERENNYVTYRNLLVISRVIELRVIFYSFAPKLDVHKLRRILSMLSKTVVTLTFLLYCIDILLQFGPSWSMIIF